MQRTHLALEQFEARELLAVFGIPWSDPTLTVSFAKDGTDVLGTQSSLYSTLAGDGLSSAVWQSEFLRAFQTWIRETNLNLGVVADSGDSYGISGLTQGDTRFGDIRIFARPLDGGVLAIANAPSTNGTIAGDIILNSNFNFSVGGGNGTYDLYTVALHEFGHSLGLTESSTASSVMYENYIGTRTGLSAEDILSIRGLYSGVRTDTTGNILSTATNITPSSSTSSTLRTSSTETSFTASSSGNLLVTGEISLNDADFYKFTTPSTLSQRVEFLLNVEGISMLDAKLTILDASGNVIETLSGRRSNLATQLYLNAGTTYFIKVEGVANSFFNVGAYQLQINYSNAKRLLAQTGLSVVVDNPTNDKLGQPTVLKNLSGPTDQPSYAYAGRIESARDLDSYLIASPTLSQTSGASSNLVVVLSTLSGGLPVEVLFYDKNGSLLTTEIIQVTDTQRIYQLKNVTLSTSYYLRVTSGSMRSYSTDYLLEARFQSWAMTPAHTQNLSLNGTQNILYQSISIATTQTVSLTLNNLGTAGPVTLKVFDRQLGIVIAEMTVDPSRITTINLLLLVGDYDFKFTTNTTNRKSIPFTFTLLTTSTPIGIDPIDPSLTPTTSTSTSQPPSTIFYVAPSFSLYIYAPTFYYWF